MMEDQSNLRKIRFANYRLDHLIGSGGFARVYKGWDAQSEMTVAIKIVDANFTEADFVFATAFLEHAGTLTSWRHKNIIRIHRAGFDDNYLYLVMEYIDGTDLAHVIERYGEEGELVPHDDVVQVARSIAQALDYLVFNADERLAMERRAHRRGYEMRWDNTAWATLQYIFFLEEERQIFTGRGVTFERSKESAFERLSLALA